MPNAIAVNRSPILLVKAFVAAFTIALGAPTVSAKVEMGEHVVLVTRAEPPDAREEAVPKPRKGYVWSRGYWMWNGLAYRWVPGEWLKDKPGHKWEHARWQTDGSQWEFVIGHWTRDKPSS